MLPDELRHSLQLQVEHPVNRRAIYEGRGVEVQKLEPLPSGAGTIKPKDYRVTLVVTR